MTIKNPHRQVELRSGNAELVCNVPDHPKLKVGNRLTLKDHPEPERLWTVTFVAEHVQDKAKIHTTWSNNI